MNLEKPDLIASTNPMILSLNRLHYRFAEASGTIRHHDACAFHGLDFAVSIAFAARYDGTRVAHAAAGGGGAAGDEACGGFPAACFAFICQKLRRVFFGSTADFARFGYSLTDPMPKAAKDDSNQAPEAGATEVFVRRLKRKIARKLGTY